ncbi:hypothetical protein R1flu_009948 [Riccia fluitans]|uniref:Uncharacterized protein n=1 Tax=Riccia fluitans TaxID=41844 RepID=A0ABD1Z3Y5_9MARC
MECVVQGILETQYVDALEVLLQGLCGGIRETVKVHEFYLKSGSNMGAVNSEVTLCCSLSGAQPVWTVRHVGGPMRGAASEQLPALVRSIFEADISNNALRVLGSVITLVEAGRFHRCCGNSIYGGCISNLKSSFEVIFLLGLRIMEMFSAKRGGKT